MGDQSLELGQIAFSTDAVFEHSVDRSLQETFVHYLEELGFDSYGNFQSKSDNYNGFVFDNTVFRLQPYWWGECECLSNEHESNCHEGEPNFVFKPTGFELSWYKYPLRSATSNAPLTFGLLTEMMQACKNSMKSCDV